VRTIQGGLDARGLAFGLVVARFNETVTRRLLEGALGTLHRCGASEDDIDVVWVPGSMELPVAARAMAASGRYAAVLCLGAVIRGETPHFEHVAGQAASGIARAALDTGRPVIFGVLTTDTTAQALERSGIKGGNKGADAALAAVEMARLMPRLAASPQEEPARPAPPARPRRSTPREGRTPVPMRAGVRRAARREP
jgi:6,7-dimethyl-8-ribityllumazine synthase